ncbi:pyrimidine dimer DNA glycosylase/endonuclease V [Myxococcota bacterium]|nr:pyrimidine dimer DNA glycosylase/endonuclease V [Myxococcota bacterium]
MNLFASDPDPVVAALALDDRRVVKMATETAQILCTVARARGIPAPWRPTHARHPTVLWVSRRRANWDWALAHGLALADEYRHRFGREHAARAVLEWAAREAAPPADGLPLEPFPQCMPEALRGTDPHQAYRRFLGQKWSHATVAGRPPRWTRRTPPPWASAPTS